MRISYSNKKHINLILLSCLFISYRVVSVELELNLSTFSHSEITSIDQLINELEGPPIEEGNTIITANSLEFGLAYVYQTRYKISGNIVFRYDYYLDFTPDTAQLFYADKNEVPLDRRRDYDIDMKANHASGSGVKIGYEYFWDENFSTKVNVSFLRMNSLVDGRLWGTLSSETGESDSSVEGNLRLDYAYTEDRLLDREETGGTGNGYSIDLGIYWQPFSFLTLDVFLKDIESNILWEQQFTTDGRANSDNISFDDNGFIDTRPVLSWWEREEDHNQRLPYQATLNVGYQFWRSHFVDYEYFSYEGVPFNRLGYRYQVRDVHNFAVGYDFDAEAKYLRISSGDFFFRLLGDTLNTEEAHTFSIDFSYHYRF